MSLNQNGKTPLPTSTSISKITFNPSEAQQAASQSPQQPNTLPIANFTAIANKNDHITGALISINSSYIAYGVKNGLVRVLNKKNTSKALLRGHNQRITDIAFFGNNAIETPQQPASTNTTSSNGTVNGGTSGGNGAPDMLGTVGGEGDCSNVLIWRIFNAGTELMSEKLLEIRLRSAARIVWHPSVPNFFILMHRKEETSGEGDIEEDEDRVQQNNVRVVGTLVETTRLKTVPHEKEGHAVCMCESSSGSGSGQEIEGSLHLVVVGSNVAGSKAGINDVCWSKVDSRHVLTSHDDGCVRLWDLKSVVSINRETGEEVDGGSEDVLLSAKCINTVRVISGGGNSDESVLRCMFVPGYVDACLSSRADTRNKSGCITSPFVTVGKGGAEVTLWSGFRGGCESGEGEEGATKVRSFEIDVGSSNGGVCPRYNVALSTVPTAAGVPSTFVLFGDMYEGNLFALHLSAEMEALSSSSSGAILTGFDYLVGLQVMYPIYSWSVTASVATETDATGLYNIDMYCVQSKAAQMLSLSPTMRIGPPSMLEEGSLLPDGVRVEGDNDNGDVEETIEKENTEEKGGVDSAAAVAVDVTDDDDNDYDDIDYDEEEIEYVEYEDSDIDEDMDDDDDEDGSSNEDESSDGDNSTGGPPPSSLPPPAFGSEEDSSGSFSNWLGNLAGVKQKNVVPPTPPVTPIVPSHSMVSGSDAGLLSDLMKVPLPPAPDLGKKDSAGNLSGSGSQSKLLSPSELMSRNDNKETNSSSSSSLPLPVLSEEKGPPGFVGSMVSSSNVVMKDTSEKKVLSNKSNNKGGNGKGGKKVLKSTQPVPVPTKEGKISILKRGDSGSIATTNNLDSIPPTNNISVKIEDSSSMNMPGMSKSELDDYIQKSVASHYAKHQSSLLNEVQKSLKREIQANVVPAIKNQVAKMIESQTMKVVEAAMKKKVSEDRILDSNKVANTVSKKLNDSLVFSFEKLMQDVMVPAYESGTREMFSQVSTSIEASNTKLRANRKSEVEMANKMENAMKRMDAMAKTIEVLIQAIAQIQSDKNETPTTTEPPNKPVDEGQVLREEILSFIGAGDFETAFTKALSASDSKIAVFTCKNCNIEDILGDCNNLKLSQPILLCLMQQLGAQLSVSKGNDMSVEVSWLQNIAVSLNPNDESISKHIVGVCQHLVDNINSKMVSIDPQMRRPLQMLIQVIRGIGAATF